jgi:hypothetical protein
MCMYIDKTGSEGEPVRVYLAAGAEKSPIDHNDLPIGNSHRTMVRLCAGTVTNRGVFDYEVITHRNVLRSLHCCSRI